MEPPKPARNPRGFFKEVGIVVLGVCLALAAQQAADWLRWQNEVTAARGALRREMTAIADFYVQRAALADCMNRRLEKAAALIADTAAGRMPDTQGLKFNGMGRLLSDSEWQSERASQTLTHFPRQELALMSRFYAQMTDVRGWVLEEAYAWARLAVLLDAPQKLGPADLAQLRVNYHLARRHYNLITVNAPLQLEAAAQLGIRPAPRSQAQNERSCNAVPFGKS